MFFEAMNFYGTFHLKSIQVDSSHFENNFKRTINCPATRANMNEPSTQRPYKHYQLLCDVHYSTMEKLSRERLIYCCVTNITDASQNESKWKFQWPKCRTVLFSNRKSYDESEQRCWPGSPL